jgi:hypothetical protein
VARNDCLYPWTDCTPIRVTSLVTGRSIVVQPSMFCDCYTRTPDQRLVDLDPRSVALLGLDWDQGLYRVTVRPARGERGVSEAMSPATTHGPVLPNTSVRQ